MYDKNNQRIQVFQLNEKFLGHFGTEGMNLGEFNCPRSADILRNGRIVVSDYGNNRIQIFELKLTCAARAKKTSNLGLVPLTTHLNCIKKLCGSISLKSDYKDLS